MEYWLAPFQVLKVCCEMDDFMEARSGITNSRPACCWGRHRAWCRKHSVITTLSNSTTFEGNQTAFIFLLQMATQLQHEPSSISDVVRPTGLGTRGCHSAAPAHTTSTPQSNSAATSLMPPSHHSRRCCDSGRGSSYREHDKMQHSHWMGHNAPMTMLCGWM